MLSTGDKDAVADAAKTAFIIRTNQAAAVGDDNVAMGNGRHDNRTTAAVTVTTSSSNQSLSNSSACSAER